MIRVLQPGEDPVFIDGRMELRPNPAAPDQGYALLGIPGGSMRRRVFMSKIGLLLTERFHEAARENGGFYLPKKGDKDRFFHASRREADESPGILVDMDARYKVTHVGIWLRRQVNNQSTPIPKDELFSLSALAREEVWQRQWVFSNPRWKNMPDLIRGQGVQMQNYPESMAYLIGLLSDPISLDDIYFAIEAAKLLGVSEESVRKRAHIKDGAPLRTIHWLSALEHHAAYRPERKPFLVTPQFEALSTKLGRMLTALNPRSARFRKLSELLQSKLRPDERATLRTLTEVFLGGVGQVIEYSQPKDDLTDTDYATAALAASYSAQAAEVKAAILGEMKNNTRHEKMHILWKMFSDNHNSTITVGIMSITADLLGGEEKVRELSDTDNRVLSPQHYQRALKVAFSELPEPRPAEFPGLTGEEEDFIGEWPEHFFPVDVETDDGRLKNVLGRLYLRGPNDHPFGTDNFFRRKFELVFKNSPHTTARRDIDRGLVLSELWPLRLKGHLPRVLWKERNGAAHPAEFMGMLFVDKNRNLRTFYRLRVFEDGGYSVYRVDPDEVYPMGCPAILAQGSKGNPPR